VMWAVILYMVGIIATIGALFLFLARLVSFFMTRAWLDELVDFDEFPLELGAAFFALIVLFVAAMVDRDNFLNPGLLEYAAGVAALINLSIIGLFLAIFAIFVVVAFIWFLIALPLEIFEAIRGRPVERVANAILIIAAFYILVGAGLGLLVIATDKFVTSAPEWLVNAASIVLLFGPPLIAMLGVAAIGIIALASVVLAMIARGGNDLGARGHSGTMRTSRLRAARSRSGRETLRSPRSARWWLRSALAAATAKGRSSMAAIDARKKWQRSGRISCADSCANTGARCRRRKSWKFRRVLPNPLCSGSSISRPQKLD
jgi:hypothetical protein